MGSRRTTTHSSIGNGRSSNGNDVSRSSRPGGCSYLSNVRPENRSTLCSVMAQLTEETQPSFETTLKSKAVSENCNVKFSCVVEGYPSPQVTWYKDDMQLDRYCGLPKYEIFRNGQSHSLHIYNCTVEDAAIYQASAINTKGIVSCSGVLEVGEMNEFKIHQRYFAKIKQKAENRHREAEGKENQEPLRTISPDRTQRKRRSTMETFLSTPSSTEDEGSEDNHHAVALEKEARLQEPTVEEAEEKPAPVTNRAVSAITSGQAINDNGSKSGTYTYDSTQKIFTAHQPKTPSVKKKIKISSSAKVAKADTLGDRVIGERRAKEESSPSVAPACTEEMQSTGSSEEVMEVENFVKSSVADTHSRRMIGEHQKSEEAVLAERPSKDEKDQHTASLPPAAHTFTSRTVSGNEGKKAAKHEKQAGSKDSAETLGIPCVISTPPRSSVAPTLQPISKEGIHTSKHVTAMDVDVKSKSSSDESLAHRHSKSVDTLCDSRTVLHQHPCEPGGEQLSEKETSSCQKKASVSRPDPPSEVTQAHTKMNRDDAPVGPELPPDRCTFGSQLPQKTQIERKTLTDDIKTSSLCSGPQAAIDNMTQITWDHSRDSNESHTVLLTHLQGFPLDSPAGGDNTPRCNVSPTALQSQVDTAIKTVEGTEVQDDEKVKGNTVDKVLVQIDSVAPNEKIVEMETETATQHMTEKIGTRNKDSSVIIVDAFYKRNEKSEPKSKVVEKPCSDLNNLMSDKVDTALPLLSKTPENTNSLEQVIDFLEIPKPATKVISIAELLRSQIKALHSTLANPVSILPTHASLLPDPTSTATSKELSADDRKGNLEVKRSRPKRETKMSIDDTAPTSIKATLMEVYQQLNKTDQDRTQNTTSPHVQALQEPLVVPPISVIDTDTSVDITGHAKKCNGSVMDIGQETKASTLVLPNDYSVVGCLSGSKIVKHNFTSLTAKDKLTNPVQSISNQSGTVDQESGSPITVTDMQASVQKQNVNFLEHAKEEPVEGKDLGLIPEIQLTGEIKGRITEMSLSTHADQGKMEEHNTNRVLQSVQKFPTESEFSSGTLRNNPQFIQPESSMADECMKSDSINNPSPEPSPLLKKRNCVSPIPSATPQELASGARRKILITKAKLEEATEATSPVDNQTQKKEVPTQNSELSTSPVTPSVSPSLSRRSPLLWPAGEQTSRVERRSPLLSRRKIASESQTPNQLPTEEIHAEGKSAEKDKYNPFKAPQVIRKIRAETFADATGHLKLWCQFFNVLSDSTIKWYKNEEEIAQVKRNAGDETQVNLAIVQASCKDSGVYGCSITNEYGTDSTDILLSADFLAGMSRREDLGVGEEIEMTPLIFNKGVADSGVWGNKFFGRIMMKESHIGDGCSHKVWRAKVIYGLEPVFESGNTCIIKVHSPIAYGGKEERCLTDKNLDIVKQECKIQNLAREYCKIFSAEARVKENFGSFLEVIPVFLMYRPANTVPYATVETDLTGEYEKYSVLDHTGRIDTRTGSEVGQKCCALQHWIFQWTNGNLLLTRLEGVDTKITNVGISVKSTGHQGLTVEGNPKVFEHFVSQHKCNYFCGLLGLRSLKIMDSLMTPTKPKGSRSPLLQRKMAAGSSSPQTGRRAAGSPRMPRKAEQDGSNTSTKQKTADAPKVVKMA
ncbi:alpha-protein kinase 3 [Brachyistius frenatus]|uniref:alpha-protein kinase 3 n=1 Tax=Brachyistius frenatus TaxID=100188 RepID=UPI0037E88EB8